MFDLFNCDDGAEATLSHIEERVAQQAQATILVVSALYEALDSSMRFQDEQLRKVENSLNRILTNRLERQDRQVRELTDALELAVESRLAEQQTLLASFQQAAEQQGYPFVSQYPPESERILSSPELREGLFDPEGQATRMQPPDLGGFASAAGSGPLISTRGIDNTPLRTQPQSPEQLPRGVVRPEGHLFDPSSEGPSTPTGGMPRGIARPQQPGMQGEGEGGDGEERGPEQLPQPQQELAPEGVPDWVRWAVDRICACLRQQRMGGNDPADFTVEPVSYLFAQRDEPWHRDVEAFFGQVMFDMNRVISMDDMYRLSMQRYDASDELSQ